MICTCCAREVVGVIPGGSSVLIGGACPQCIEIAEAMQALWEQLPDDEQPVGLASAVGHCMRVVIEHNVPVGEPLPRRPSGRKGQPW